MKKNKDIILVKHILDAIADIEEFTSKSDSLREEHSEIPFYKIIGMRNVMVHAYWQIDERIVWDACKNDLPELKQALLKIR